MSLLATAAAVVAAAVPTPERPVVVDGYAMSRGWLRHWADIAQRSAGGNPPRQPAREQAAAFLIDVLWYDGEARDRGIVVTPAEVRREFRAQREQAFPKRREYRAFLRESGQTSAMVRMRVRLSMQAGRIYAQVAAGVPEDEGEAAVDAFILAFRAKWKARTACRAPWIARSCGEIVSRRRP